jgi:sarcosine oxidase subunit beta
VTVDIAIVGAGLLGVHTAWRLAEAGAEVVVLEQGVAGDGSTGRSAGGLRKQFTTPYEIRLSAASRAFYERLEQDPDHPVPIDRVGYLFLAGPGERSMLERSHRVQQSEGVVVEWLEGAALQDALPYCDLPDGAAATQTRDDGFVDPWAVHQWLLHRARAAGATLRQHAHVNSIRRDGLTWLVDDVRAHQVVLAAGAWTGAVAERSGLAVPVTASPRVKVLTDLHPHLPELTPLIMDLSTGAYVRSERGQVLVGANPVAPPVGFDFDTSLEHLASIMQRASIRFPSLASAGIVRALCGLYELTPDGLPLAGRVPGQPGLWVVAGFNGHGIMHGPAVSDALCCELSGTPAQIDLEPLSPARSFVGHAARGAAALL